MKNKKSVKLITLLTFSILLTGCSLPDNVKNIFTKGQPAPITVSTIMQNQNNNIYYTQATVKMDSELDFAYNAGLKNGNLAEIVKDNTASEDTESDDFTDAGNISGVRSLEDIKMPDEYVGSEYLISTSFYVSLKDGVTYSEQIKKIGNAYNGNSIGSTKEVIFTYNDLSENLSYIKKDGLWYKKDKTDNLKKYKKENDYTLSGNTTDSPLNLSKEYKTLLSCFMQKLPQYINDNNTEMTEDNDFYYLTTQLDLSSLYHDSDSIKDNEIMSAFMEITGKENIVPHGNIILSSKFDKNSFAISELSLSFDNDAITYLDHMFDDIFVLDIVFNRCQIKFEYLDKEMSTPISVKKGSILEENRLLDISDYPVFKNFN